MWVYEIYNPDGDLIAELHNATNRSFNLRLNSITQASFTLDLHDLNVNTDILNVGRNELRIRNNSTYFWGGIILDLRGIAEGDEQKIQITAFSYEWWLQKRILESGDTIAFTSDSAGTIIDTLITETQAKNSLGLTQGAVEATTSIDRTYKIRDRLWHNIKLLTRLVDFEISPLKIYNSYTKQGVTRNVELIYPKGNILGFGYTRSAMQMANELHIIGAGLDDAAVVGEVADTTQQTAYKLLQDLDYYDSDNETILEAYGTKELTDVKTPIITITSLKLKSDLIKIGSYALGDTFRLKLTWGNLLNINNLYRIEEINVAIDENDYESVKLGVSLA